MPPTIPVLKRKTRAPTGIRRVPLLQIGRASASCSGHSHNVISDALLRHGHELQHVTVGILEVHSSTAIPIVELAVVKTPGCAAKSETLLFDARENGIELGVAH